MQFDPTRSNASYFGFANDLTNQTATRDGGNYDASNAARMAKTAQKQAMRSDDDYRPAGYVPTRGNGPGIIGSGPMGNNLNGGGRAANGWSAPSQFYRFEGPMPGGGGQQTTPLTGLTPQQASGYQSPQQAMAQGVNMAGFNTPANYGQPQQAMAQSVNMAGFNTPANYQQNLGYGGGVVPQGATVGSSALRGMPQQQSAGSYYGKPMTGQSSGPHTPVRPVNQPMPSPLRPVNQQALPAYGPAPIRPTNQPINYAPGMPQGYGPQGMSQQAMQILARLREMGLMGGPNAFMGLGLQSPEPQAYRGSGILPTLKNPLFGL